MYNSQTDQQTQKLQDKKKSVQIPFDIDQDIKSIDLKPIEQKRLDIVYNSLIDLENEPSSDEDSLMKKHLKLVEQNAEKKRMDQDQYKNQEYIQDKKKKEQKNKSKAPKTSQEDSKINNNEDVKNKSEIKIGKKALRKMLRLYIEPKKFTDEDIEQMIWEVDEDMDGKVSKYEMEKMYKRCIVDKQELEPKKLFYFIQFLMFDKENKRSISEEDTLELLRVRHRGDKEFNAAIDEIFYPNGHKGVDNKDKDEPDRLNYEEFINVMTDLILKKREEIRDKRDNYCNHINDNK